MPAKAVTVTATYKDAPVTTYAVTVNSGTGGGNFAEGATVSITANAPATGKVFDKWTTSDGVVFANANSATTTFVMPAKAVTVTATYKDAPVTTYAVTVNSGTGGGNFAAGATVSITANAPATGKVFDKWTTSDGVVFANANTATTTFVMPAKAVTVTATYKDAPVTTYAVTVNSGTGGGNFAAGATVSITANAPATGKVFDKWTTSDGVVFANTNSATTTFVMPAKAVTVTATYKDAPVDPDPEKPVDPDPEKPVDPDPEKFSYKIIKGANGKWDKTSKAGLEFISNGDFDKFEEVKVDGKTIDKKHYSAKAGSTIVTLKDSLLSTLGKGDHSLTLVFEDGKVETKFTILEKETLPKTGGAVYPTMLFGFILLLAGVFMYRRREA
jgi:LPXTG-motif cell wall-anchored protein